MKKNWIVMAIAALSLAGCDGDSPQPLTIDNQLTEAEISAGRFTPEVMWKMGRIGSSQLSPNGEKLLYTVTYYNVEENRGVTAIYLRDMKSAEVSQLTDHTSNNVDPHWSHAG